MDGSFSVPDSVIIAIIMGMAGVTFAWLRRLEAKAGRAMTRQEHTDICTKQQITLKEDLEEIKRVLREQNEKSEAYRENTSETLYQIRLKLARNGLKGGNR